jgi:O-antigen/teichoic acid export membrane protein
LPGEMTESKANIYGSFVKYAIAIGFYRGVNFLLVPILPALLGVAGYGLFNLTQLTAQMILPIVGLNAATGILREGAEDVGVGQKIFNSQNNLSIIIVLLLLPVIYLVDRSTSNWVTYAVALSLLDVILLNRLTLLRASDNVNSYLILTLAKIGGFLAIIFFLKHVYQEIDLATVLLFQLGWYGVVTFGSINWKKYTFEISRSVLAPVFAYTLVLIPHSFFQWVINNSDKYIVKFLYGDLAVGEYSIIYNIAMIFFLLNSGISLTLPQFIFKNYENWMKARVRRKFIIGYSILSFLASACIIIAAFIELNFLRLTSI